MSAVERLEAMSAADLERASRALDYPKWSTMCLLRLLGEPTLRAVLMRPALDRQDVRRTLRDFAETCRNTTIMVRSDGGRENGKYYNGGSSFVPERAEEEAIRLLAASRAVILMEGTDRFSNRLSFVVVRDHNGNWAAEILGPGFDASDLNRGGLSGEFRFQGTMSDDGNPLVTDCWRAPPADRVKLINLRLSNIARRILPGMDIVSRGEGEQEVEDWLRQRHLTALWSKRPEIGQQHLKPWLLAVENAYRWIRQYHEVDAISLSGSRLGDGRLVYWDIVVANMKWGARG